MNTWNKHPYSSRYYEIHDKIKTLPVWLQRHEFLDMLDKYQNLILVRDTGSGKTTKRRGETSMFTSLTHHKKRLTCFISLDYDMCNGYIKEIVTDVLHDHDRGAPLYKVTFKHTFCHNNLKELFVVVEVLHSEQFVYCENNEGGYNMLSRERERTNHSGLDEGPGDTAGVERYET
jgi:ribosomal protein L2